MFGLFGRKPKVSNNPRPDYEALFSSRKDTHRYIYGDRKKTVEILGGEDFIEAWLDSKHTGQVSAIISQEAMAGDVPSLKQMIWLCDLCYNDAENITRDRAEQTKRKKHFMQERISFCQKAIELGLMEHSYTAMASCAKIVQLNDSLDDAATRDALRGAVRYAKMFLESRNTDPGLIEDAKGVLERYGRMDELFGATRTPSEPPALSTVGDIEKLFRTLGAQRAGEVIRAAADAGSVLCQIFMSGAGLNIPAERRPPHVQRETEHYTRLAAESGDPNSQFNLAKLHIAKLDTTKGYWEEADLDNIRQAKRWHRKAAAQGLQSSVEALKNLECFGV